ncbi:MAG: hypothetical protein IH958_04855 [Chloroflexi bacterium]|nr:hypothetical protein [Chloroflexota bacterium]
MRSNRSALAAIRRSKFDEEAFRPELRPALPKDAGDATINSQQSDP